MKLRRSRKSLMRFGSELARVFSDVGVGVALRPAWMVWPTAGPLLSRPCGLGSALGLPRLGMLLPRSAPRLVLSLRDAGRAGGRRAQLPSPVPTEQGYVDDSAG